mmetsp:Transcript_37365/g.59876  ORF Transcript_37365/g.59876 Transcript_37365/m.59876 type:complete len:96 (-) Transcript_37365:84-371(-)
MACSHTDRATNPRQRAHIQAMLSKKRMLEKIYKSKEENMVRSQRSTPTESTVEIYDNLDKSPLAAELELELQQPGKTIKNKLQCTRPATKASLRN